MCEKVYPAEYVRLLDENAELLGISKLQLMEASGKSVAECIASRIEVKGAKVVVVAGLGNNGGDGFVAARYLASKGAYVTVILLGKKSEIRTSEAMRNWLILEGLRTSVQLHEVSDVSTLEELRGKILEADIVVDAIFGIGFKGELRGIHAEAVKLMNKARGLKVAIDIPSGIEADTGKVGKVAFKADVTITFQVLKPALVKVREYCGKVVVADIGIPPEAFFLVSMSEVRACFHKRNPFSKKGDHGKVLVIGGSYRFSGAPAFSAMAALYCGVDLSFIMAPRCVVDVIRSFSPDLIVLPLKGEKFLTLEDVPHVLEWIDKVDVAIIGPGLGLEEETLKAVRSIVVNSNKPLVIDADAIKALGGYLDDIKGHELVFTPHSKEFEILTGRSLPPPQDLLSRMSVVREEARKYNIVILLKGKEDIISDGKYVKVNMTGNALMTVGGTGDTLTGIIAALIAMGNPLIKAACAGAFINGLAGDLAARKELFLTTSKLIKYIPKALKLIIKEPLVSYSLISRSIFKELPHA